MNISLLITVENSRPEISRCINVDHSMYLGELALIIDATLGFSSAATHMFSGTINGEQRVYTAQPAAGEYDENDLTVQDMPETMSYIYDAGANWNINVQVLGPSTIAGPTPVLISALGPDVIEHLKGPAMMTELYDEAVRLAAGQPADIHITPTLFSAMPVMSPGHMVDRLTKADPVSISNRMYYSVETMVARNMMNPDAAAEEDEDVREALREYLANREDLKDIMAIDPNPESNPAVMAAIGEFLEDYYGPNPTFDSPVYTGITEALYNLMDGLLPDDPIWRRHLHNFFVESGFMRAEQTGRYTITNEGVELLSGGDNPFDFAENIARGFYATFGRENWNQLMFNLISDSPHTADSTIYKEGTTLLASFGFGEKIDGEFSLNGDGYDMLKCIAIDFSS